MIIVIVDIEWVILVRKILLLFKVKKNIANWSDISLMPVNVYLNNLFWMILIL